MTKKEMWNKFKQTDNLVECFSCGKIVNDIIIFKDYSCGENEFMFCEKCFVGVDCLDFLDVNMFPYKKLENINWEKIDKLFIENKEPPNTSKEYIQKICDSAYEEDKEAIDEAIKYLGGK